MYELRRHLLATAAAVTIVAVSQLGVLDDAGRAYTEAGFERALIAYGVARGLNGVISVAQGTEVAVEPGGVGMTFKPGEILDPINDLIERFSWIVLVSGTSLGIQRVLLEVTAVPWFRLAVSILVLAYLAIEWRPGAFSIRHRRMVRTLAAVLVIVRFAIPIIAIAGEALYEAFLEPQYTESTQNLEETAAVIRGASDEPVGPTVNEDSSMLTSALRAYRSARDAVDFDARIAVLKEAASDVGEYTIDLIVVFVLQTILFPLLFLWTTLQLLKRCTRAASSG
ncbi:MAG: hypothetical protein E4H03_07005 [Myxococcales bacterium]|nr:MAG: hypothetical protein E4H03_07005 [Myxococcales bacterium]